MITIDMDMPKNCGDCRFRNDGWCYAIQEFEFQPSNIDNCTRPNWCPLKEAVRCKDCKWWDTDGYKCGFGECPNVFCETTADWFCADGERKHE